MDIHLIVATNRCPHGEEPYSIVFGAYTSYAMAELSLDSAKYYARERPDKNDLSWGIIDIPANTFNSEGYLHI